MKITPEIFISIIIILIIYFFYNLNFSPEKKEYKCTIEDFEDALPEQPSSIIEDFHQYISKYKFHDENDNLIDHYANELDEQYLAYKYIEPNDIVLELGARYGTVSVVINSLINNKNNHVVIEPDETVINALIKNKFNNNCSFQIVNKFIANKNKKLINDGYGTRLIDVENNDENMLHMSYDHFKKLHPLKFNVLIADCEGCFYEFISMLGDDLYNYNKIMFEEDMPELCDYSKVKKHLENYGFTLIEEKFNIVNRCVYIKK
jgi:FkbM family methyltransferase